MPYRYRCGICRTTSRAYLTRLGAVLHGRTHRQERHNGDHPDGEQILHTPHPAPAWPPTKPKGRAGGEGATIVVIVGMAVVAIWVLFR